MRLLHVTPCYGSPRFGGVSRATRALARALVRRGHEVVVLTSTEIAERGWSSAPPEAVAARAARTAQLAGESEDEGVKVVRLPARQLPAAFGLPWPRGAGEALDRLVGFDVVHLHVPRQGLAVAALGYAVSQARPLVLQPHGTAPRHGRFVGIKRLFDELWGDRLFEAASLLLAVSRAEARDLGRPAVVIPNGVEAPGPLPGPRDRLAVEKLSGQLLFVGNDRPQKQGLALRSVLEALPRARLDCVGPLGASFRAAWSSFGDRVRFRGVLEGEALACAYAEAELLLHPARDESFGLAPFESALCGTAAVVAGGHGCGEWFGEAGGAVVPPDDPRAFVLAVRERLVRPELASAEAARVARFAREKLSWEAVAIQMEAAYLELLDRR